MLAEAGQLAQRHLYHVGGDDKAPKNKPSNKQQRNLLERNRAGNFRVRWLLGNESLRCASIDH